MVNRHITLMNSKAILLWQSCLDMFGVLIGRMLGVVNACVLFPVLGIH